MIYIKINLNLISAVNITMSKRVYRNIQSLLLFATIIVLTVGFYFEYGKGLQPCPLCLMQRLCTFLFGMFCLMGLCLGTLKRARTVAVLQMLMTAAGIFFAGRQIWLQSLPVDKTPACMPSLDMLIHYFSKTQVLQALLWGTGDCADVTWRWLGLSMPAWSALYFVGMLLASATIFWSLGRRMQDVELL